MGRGIFAWVSVGVARFDHGLCRAEVSCTHGGGEAGEGQHGIHNVPGWCVTFAAHLEQRFDCLSLLTCCYEVHLEVITERYLCRYSLLLLPLLLVLDERTT